MKSFRACGPAFFMLLALLALTENHGCIFDSRPSEVKIALKDGHLPLGWPSGETGRFARTSKTWMQVSYLR